MKLSLREVRAEQSRRVGGKEHEQAVQPETLIKARHQLSRAKRDLGRYLTGVDGKGDRRSEILGRGSDIRITKGLIQAMRSRFGKDVGRDVNLLLANVMLLQQKVDAEARQPAIDDLEAKLWSAQQSLSTALSEVPQVEVLDPYDREQLRAAGLVEQALVLQASLEQLDAETTGSGRRRNMLDESQLERLGGHQTRLHEVMAQLDDLHTQGIIDDDTHDLLTGARDDNDELFALGRSVDATLTVAQATTDLVAARADQQLGLDDAELAQLGLTHADIEDVHAAIGGLARQGLKSSADVERTTKAIEQGVKLLERGMTQDTLARFSGAVAESRANMFMDLAFQDVVGDHQNFGLGAGSDQVRQAYRAALDTFSTDPVSGQESGAFTQLRRHAESYDQTERSMAADARQLMAADDANQAALDRLALAAEDGRKIDPQDDETSQASSTLLAALHADDRAQDRSLDPKLRQLWAAERDRMLGSLAGFDPRRMKVTRSGRKANPDPVTVDRLRTRLAGLAGLADAIGTVHHHERRAGLIRARIEDRAQELDDLLDLRRAGMGGGDPSDPNYDPTTNVHKLVQNGIRAAALHVRHEQGIALDRFNPIDHRDAIEAVLADWGIDPDLFAPEINDTLHAAFDPKVIDGWIDDAKATLSDRDFQTRLKEQPNAAWRTLRRLPTDRARIDQTTRTKVVSMIKSLRAGDALEVGQDHTLGLSSGRVPLATVGVASLTARATGALASKNQLAIACQNHEIEVFIKSGFGGQGTLEASADVTLAEATLAGTGGGHKLQGVALRFPNTEQGRTDLAALMDNLLSETPDISAGTFAKADEVLMVTDRMVQGGVEAEALSTTAMWADKFPGAGWLGKTAFTGQAGGYAMDLSLGAKARLGAGVEGRFVWSDSARSNVYEKEVVKDVAVHARLGLFSETASVYDHGLSQIPGASAKVGAALSHGVHSAQGDYADEPFAGVPRTVAGVGYDRVLYKTTKITRVNQDSDGRYQSHGNELVRRRTVQRIPRTNGQVDTAHMLASLALDQNDDPRKRGLETDPLTAALQDPANGAFRESVEALLQQIERGDTLSVTYTLDPEVRRIANDLRQEAIDLRAGRPGPHLDEVGSNRAKADELAVRLDRQAAALIGAEASYIPRDVQIIKASATKASLDLLNLKLLKLERTGYGGLQRAAVTATNPLNPEDLGHGGHGHGPGGPTVALPPEVHFGAPRPQQAPLSPQPTAQAQAPPQPPQPSDIQQVEEVEGQEEAPVSALLTPALSGFEALNWEAALVLASPYRPLDAQLDHLQSGLKKLQVVLTSVDPNAQLEVANDLRNGIAKLDQAISAAEKLPKRPEPKEVEQHYAQVRNHQSEPLTRTILRAKDEQTWRTPGPVPPGVERGAELAGVEVGASPAIVRALRTMAEHARGASFLIMDGVLPGNDGRDYVLRRIIRRAVQQAVAIGVEKPFLATLTDTVVEHMRGAYPALVEAQPEIRRVVDEEEVRFRRTLDQGMGILEEALRRARDAGTELPAEVAFELHDTYGFPFDLTREIAAEEEMTVDEERFGHLMEEQRERARAAQKEGAFASGPGEVDDFQRRTTEVRADFVGYERLEVFTVVRALGELGGGRVAVKLAESPFYAEGGGQVADTGWIHTDSGRLEVESVVKFENDQVVVARQVEGKVVEGERAKAMVNAVRRHQTACNHTATHLLHNALRIVLGEHVRQGGSMVRPERLRFDFAVREAPTAEQLRQVEDLVNRRIIENHPVRPFVTTREYAAEIGALAFFEEKYGEFVRVLEIDDFSRELCGGTHVSSTSQIGLFKITSSQSVGANTRRIEAITSAAAVEHYRGLEHEWDALSGDAARCGRTGSPRPSGSSPSTCATSRRS